MSEDHIKRSDAIDVIKKNHYRLVGHGLTEELLLEQLRSLPSVDRPRGRWIVNEESGTSACSHCGIVWQFIDGTTGSRFCPDCGADMRDPAAADGSAWIPCSERLPSEQGQYLVTLPLYNGEPWVYVLSFHKGKFYETDDEWGDVEYDDVTAWMPLPKPYERGADDDSAEDCSTVKERSSE